MTQPPPQVEEEKSEKRKRKPTAGERRWEQSRKWSHGYGVGATKVAKRNGADNSQSTEVKTNSEKEKTPTEIGVELTEPYVSQYDQSDPDFHDYKIAITKSCLVGDGKCSVKNVASIVDQESVPLTSDPKAGNLDIMGQQPIVHFNPSETVSINQTRVGHWFHPGRVVHVTYEHKGAVYVFTRGAGVGSDPGWNKAIGGLLFGKMHVDVKHRVRDELVRKNCNIVCQ